MRYRPLLSSTTLYGTLGRFSGPEKIENALFQDIVEKSKNQEIIVLIFFVYFFTPVYTFEKAKQINLHILVVQLSACVES